SYGLHSEWIMDFLVHSRLQLPSIAQMGVASLEYLETLHKQLQQDTNFPTFHALLVLISAWGSKPQKKDRT
ncbi:MAG: hypothetical protein ACRDF4_06635, partial [Rhabdochlamydiaceae bacterium]